MDDAASTWVEWQERADAIGLLLILYRSIRSGFPAPFAQVGFRARRSTIQREVAMTTVDPRPLAEGRTPHATKARAIPLDTLPPAAAKDPA